ncbi:MAG: amino acid ABC transporter permease [Ktedonobacterales bacterium]
MNQILAFYHHFDWGIVLPSLFKPLIIQGLIFTVLISVISQFAGTVIGLVLYFLRRSRFAPMRFFADAYIWFYRGTPLLVQILFLYLALPYLGIAVPLRNFDFFGAIGFTPELFFLDSFLAGVVALSLNEGAYMSEIVRAGIDSMDIGQMEAARSLGMTYAQGMRRIVLPQAMRVIVPPLGNEFNNMLKTTALISDISFYELLGAAKQLGNPSFRGLELLVSASIWYLVLTTVWGFIQSVIERRLGASSLDPALRNTRWWERLMGIGRGVETAPAIPGTVAGVPPVIQGDRR